VVDAAGLRAGETILITGVTGAVGGAAARIARWKGARVIGTIRKAGEQNAVADLPVDQYLNLEDGPLPESVMSATAGQGVQVVFDVVGGPLFETCLRCLANRGRHVAIASTGDGRVGFNLVDFYHRDMPDMLNWPKSRTRAAAIRKMARSSSARDRATARS
jgi:NADPH:quinone reductase